jgi:hypothetical protein
MAGKKKPCHAAGRGSMLQRVAVKWAHFMALSGEAGPRREV